MTDIYYKFIQFSLGIIEGQEFLDGSALKDFNWGSFFDFAKKQTLLGIIFDGIQKLPKEHAPSLNLLMTWFGISQKIKQHNKRLNLGTAAIYNKVSAEGFHCCILKGQGNAVMYPNPAARTPGDVDVWVDANRENIRKLAHSMTKDEGHIADESLNHIGLTIGNITVELHSTPGFMASCIYNKRLQKWLKGNIDAQCCHKVSLPDNVGEVAVPTNDFNILYQLYHLYHHYFYEGVGLRQVVDYYYVIKNAKSSYTEHSLKHLGLWKFAKAMMYVLHVVMGLSEEQMIVPMDAKRGKMLLDDILNGGNFGQHAKHYQAGGDGLALLHNFLRLGRDARLLRYYPAEALSEPFFRIWHFWWRKKLKRNA